MKTVARSKCTIALALMSLIIIISLTDPALAAVVYPPDSHFVEISGTVHSSNPYGQAHEKILNATRNDEKAEWSEEISGIWWYTYPYEASLTISASLHSGSIKIDAEASGLNTYAGGYAFLMETVYIVWPENYTQPFDAWIWWDVFGNLTSGYAEASLNGALGGPSYMNYTNTITDDLTDGVSALSMKFVVDPTNPEHHYLSMLAHMTATAVNGRADFGHTGLLNITLPDECSFESASGVFLSEQVPIPGAVWLLGSGLLGLIGLKRKLKK